MEESSFALPSHGNPIVLDWIRDGKAVFQPGPLDTPCLIWQKSKIKGYGQICINYKNLRAHRVAINCDSTVSLHTCHTRSCVNPHHIYEGTYIDHSIERVNKGSGLRLGKRSRCACGRSAYGNGHKCRPCTSMSLGVFCHCGEPVRARGLCARHYSRNKNKD